MYVSMQIDTYLYIVRGGGGADAELEKKPMTPCHGPVPPMTFDPKTRTTDVEIAFSFLFFLSPSATIDA